MATDMAPNVDEGKLLSESLSTVKIQVQQMKRHLVSTPQHCASAYRDSCAYLHHMAGARPAHGRAEKCQFNVG